MQNVALPLAQIDADESDFVFQPPFGGLPEVTRSAGGAITFLYHNQESATTDNCKPTSTIFLQIAKNQEASRGVSQISALGYAKQFAYMNEAFARLCTADDAKEGVQAFFEKRKPVWKEK
jgi:enoyl-CoA hydratase/carnithine racemase